MQNHLMHAILAHMHFSVLFSLPGPTLCIFHVHLVLQSVPLHMKAHSLSLSLSLFLPPSLPFYSLALRAFEMVMSRDSADVFIPLVLGLGAPQLSAH